MKATFARVLLYPADWRHEIANKTSEDRYSVVLCEHKSLGKRRIERWEIRWEILMECYPNAPKRY